MMLVKDWSQLIVSYIIQLPEKFRGQSEKKIDLANTTNESQIKGEQQLKCLTESVEFISARFDEYEERS